MASSSSFDKVCVHLSVDIKVSADGARSGRSHELPYGFVHSVHSSFLVPKAPEPGDKLRIGEPDKGVVVRTRSVSRFPDQKNVLVLAEVEAPDDDNRLGVVRKFVEDLGFTY
jgi:hypothetical protein